ncbi:MAG: glycosyltransferase family A protein [Victivallaceae bacterium]|nr:glycosyltransferase family A protein [Victivallaceae bacterium]
MPEDEILVSVVIPSHNLGRYLPESLNSVLASDVSCYEIIVVDDGSTDAETESFLDSYRHEKVRIVRQANAGVAAARNRAISLARGKYILPLDSDDRIAPEYIGKALALMDQYDIVTCRAEFFGREEGLWELPEYDFHRFLNENCIFVTSMFRKSDWEKSGGFKSCMKHGNEDWEFFITLIEGGATRVFRIPEVLFYYRRHQNSRTDGLNYSRIAESCREILRLHSQLYVENIADCRVFFQNVYRVEVEAERARRRRRTLAEKLWSVEELPDRRIIRCCFLKISLRRKAKKGIRE